MAAGVKGTGRRFPLERLRPGQYWLEIDNVGYEVRRTSAGYYVPRVFEPVDADQGESLGECITLNEAVERLWRAASERQEVR